MKNVLIFVCIIMVSTVFGCATRGINISKNGTVTIQRVASEKVFVPWADAYQDGNDLVINGAVQQQYCEAPNFLKVYINVTITNTRGQLLKQARTEDMDVSSNRPCRAINWTHFKLTVPMVVPKGVIIKLAVHGA